ncbi:MAG: flagellar L-ring protein precursor FlgH [Gallionellaceae bacterium]|nr:MAG: flagellar L-ring protein precursor FlgH [Gallionellaceae bacterium]
MNTPQSFDHALSFPLYQTGVLLVSLALTACVPTTNIKDPLTVRPEPKAAVVAPANGAIFQAGVSDRQLFEDRRARRVGDTLTITIVESTSATGKSATTSDNSGSLSIVTPAMPMGASGSSTAKSGNKMDASGANTFSGTLTSTVTEVLPNGNLRVAGEKQVSIRYTNEYVRFSGVVNPVDISAGNTVPSTKVADVHLEYKGAVGLSGSDVTSMFARIFTTVLPF